MDSYNDFNTATNGWTGSGTPQYSYNERIAYDGNGNILKYLRNANSYNSGPVMDSLTYKYYTGTNRLQRVTDRATSFDSEWGANSWEYNLDINHQTQTSNYLYDPIGNLIKDTSEKITSIKWSVYGKIQEINRVATTQNPVTKIVYKYDAQGNRIGKIVTKNTGVREHTWYVRDAQGNVMATYGASGTNADNALNGLTTGQNERYLYGSSRLGVDNWYMPADSNTVYDYNYPGLNSATYYYRRGWKQYELSNHLGNVLATISDKKIGIPLPSSSLIDYYEPVVVSAQDYYPFGMLMPKRSYAAAAGYRFGFNGKETDNDVKGIGNQVTYENRIYDPRIAKWLSLDPLQKKYPNESHYAFTSGNPIIFKDLDGRDKIITITIIDKDGRSTTVQKIDKKYFYYYADARMGGMGLYFMKADVEENYIIDYSKNVLSLTSTVSNRQRVSAYEYSKVSDVINFFGNLGGDQSKNEKIGYVLLGSSLNEQDNQRNPRAASGSQVINIEKLANALEAWREFGIGSKQEIFDFAKSSNLKKYLSRTDNLTDAVTALQNANDGDVPLGPLRKKELPPDFKDPNAARIEPGKDDHKRGQPVYCRHCNFSVEWNKQGKYWQVPRPGPVRDTMEGKQHDNK